MAVSLRLIHAKTLVFAMPAQGKHQSYQLLWDHLANYAQMTQFWELFVVKSQIKQIYMYICFYMVQV